ncbi:MAG: GNAT family N-acetyltransferase [Gaiellaceae bacterium]
MADRPTELRLEINASTRDDLEQLYLLAKAAFGDVPGWSDRRVMTVLRRDFVFVAREHAKPVGYVALRRDEATGSVVIDQLLVAPGHEQRGIGRRLLGYAEGYAIAQRVQTIRIVAEQDNRPARSFYQRSGFVPVKPELLELVLPRVD